jgi:hypothetical protein
MNDFRRLLSMEDLYQTDPSLSSEFLRDEVQSAWNRRCKLHCLSLHSRVRTLIFRQPSLRIGTH